MMSLDEKDWLAEFIEFQNDSMLFCWSCDIPLAQLWGSAEEDNVELEEIADGFVVYANQATKEPCLWLCRHHANQFEDGQDKGRN